MEIKRLSTGVKGLDKMIGGGIPDESITGLEGPAGVGKSILALQFIFEGAAKGEKSVYINLEEPRENIERTLKTMSFGKRFLELEKKGTIKIICLNYEEFEKAYSSLFKKITEDKKIRRLVIDSFNCFFSYLKMESPTKASHEVRKVLSESFASFRKTNLATLLLLENGSEVNRELNHYISYMADGIIHLDFISIGSIERRVFVPKMRWTNQYDSSLPFEISGKGIKVRKP